MKEYVIGIDPDIDKNGLAFLKPTTREISLHSMPLPMLIDYITSMYEKYGNKDNFIVAIEAGWINKGNYHLMHYDSKQSAARKGMDQGKNHQRGIDIVELLQAKNIPVTLVKPLPLLWKHKKISHEELAHYMPIVKKKTNQEERDAALIAWITADLPFVLSK